MNTNNRLNLAHSIEFAEQFPSVLETVSLSCDVCVFSQKSIQWSLSQIMYIQ